MNFEEAFQQLISNEGNYTNDTRDNGNWTGGKPGRGQLKGTKYGISAASYPELNIKGLTLEQAKAIYLRDFWKPFNFTENNIPKELWFDLFDLAVNACAPGKPTQAVKILQRALGVVDDGVIGVKTKSALLASDPQLLDKRLSAHRLLFLANLSVSDWQAFGKGWVIRIANNMIKD